MTERIRILVVDDHHVVRQGLVALLNIMPSIEVVGEAEDGLEAIELYRSSASGHNVDGPAAPKTWRRRCHPKIRAEIPLQDLSY